MPRQSQIRWEVYLRKRGDSHTRPICYVRAIDRKTGTILLVRSVGSSSKKAARDMISELSTEIDFDKLAAMKTQARDAQSSDMLSHMRLLDFFLLFWDTQKSPYLKARTDSEKPLSGLYIKNQMANIRHYAMTYAPFKETILLDASLFLVESYLRHLRESGIKPGAANDALDAIRTPLSWAMKRGLLLHPFSFGSIIRPKEEHRKRDILSIDELQAIIALEVQDIMQPRPRLKNDRKNDGPAPIDLRVKVGILLGHLCAMRAGEIRGLCWRSVDFENRRIAITDNYVEIDGRKSPKADSFGFAPMPDPVYKALIELRKVSFTLGFYGPDNYVLFNVRKNGLPIALSTLEDGFARACALIGIPDDRNFKKEGREPHPESRQGRHLVFHSGRHLAASLLADTVGPEIAKKITRHRTIAAFEGYASHQTKEDLDQARRVLNI